MTYYIELQRRYQDRLIESEESPNAIPPAYSRRSGEKVGVSADLQ